MTTKRRKDPTDRRAEIVAAAVHVAERDGIQRASFGAVAEVARCSRSTVVHYYPTLPQLHRDLMRAAIRRECLPVVAEGLARRDRHALKAPEQLKDRALQFIRG